MRPLTHWRIRAARLPERLTEDTLFDASFRLPGADALSAFADLLGGAPDEDCGSAPDMQEADFTLPAAIPADVSGTVELAVELDFGTLCADDAELTLELVRGKGGRHAALRVSKSERRLSARAAHPRAARGAKADDPPVL